MELYSELKDISRTWEEPVAVNARMRQRLALELAENHYLSPRAIARILHVEESWVAAALSQKEEQQKETRRSPNKPRSKARC